MFCLVLNEVLHEYAICTEVLRELDAYARVAARLRESTDDLKQALQNLGKSGPEKFAPWRAEQKLAALAALFSLE
jgi:hypothetical protein